MYSLRRWWDQHSLRVGLIGLAISVALLIRYTQGAVILELYQGISWPFQGSSSQQEVLENAYIQELKQQVSDLESRNTQLEELLGYLESSPSPGVVAPVIGRSADHWWHQILLGRGSSDGVKVGDVVTGTGGLVGRVTAVTPNTSRVLLISDPTSQIGVTVSRSRYMGYIRGQSENRVVMEFFDKVPDVRPGDVITTSSFSQLYPSGLTVGVVESVNLSKSPAPEAVIELSAPISRLEWVVIYPGLQPSDELLELPSEPSPSNSLEAVPSDSN
jgi:rod shape-determining protein MreC